MAEDSDDIKEKILERFNKKQYRRRFGVSYSNKSAKKLDIYSSEIKTKKNTKIIKYSNISNNTHSITNDSSFHGKTIINNLFNEMEKIELDQLYVNFENESEDILPIQYFNKVNNCSILKYGIKKSTEEIEYSYCKTCDPNLLRPICLCCINQCHKGHSIKYIFNRGRIKCCCGEKNHIGMKVNVIDKTIDINCLCNEWNVTAKLNFYYINKNKEPICIFCHNCCQEDNKVDKLIKIEDNQTIPKCSCKNEEIHNDNRIICDKMLNLITNSNEFDLLLHPIQIVNMLFKSINSFKMIFEYFETFMNDLKNNKDTSNIVGYFSKIHSVDITYTNIFKSLLLFEKIIKKTSSTSNNMCYYNEEVVNFFSFQIIKKLLILLKKSTIEEKIFWILANKYLYLFHKIYINIKTQLLDKYKLNDLKNLSFYQRIVIFNENRKRFKESEEIISFLLKFLIDLTNKGLYIIESIEFVKEIISIFTKLSCYNLIHIYDMTKICKILYKCINYIRIMRNSVYKSYGNYNDNIDVKSKNDSDYFNLIALKIYYIVIKMLLNFIYNYNDNIINKFIYDKEIELDNNSISLENLDNICFIYKKNELGRLIFKITICILTSIQKYYNGFENKRIIVIQRIGMQILQYPLNKYDEYITNIIGSLNKFNFYFEKSKKIKIDNNLFYKELSRQCNLISNAYYQYFNFEISVLDMIEVINKSLNFVLEDSVDYIDNILSIEQNEVQKEFNFNQKIAILSTNYYSLISKVINIMHHHQSRKKNKEKNFENHQKDNVIIGYNNEKNLENKKELELNDFFQTIPMNIEDEIIKKIIFFYFCFSVNSSDNSFLILSHYIFNELIKLPIKYCQLIFKLFYMCLKNVLTLENNIIISEKSFIIKRLYGYLENLIDETSIKQNTMLFCIYYFLQIIEITIFNSQTSLYNIFIYKIQYIIYNINKKYNLVNKYFEMKDDEALFQVKNDNKNENNIMKIKRMATNVNQFQFDKKNKNKNSLGFDFYKRSILKKSFLIFIKLINNCFDFSIEIDRKKIGEIIKADKVIFALKNYKINLDLRTEFIRFLRKTFLDLKYNINENNLFTKAIINNQDNLKFIKNNKLINNMEYPTRLLSFLNDFYNITAKCNLEEKIDSFIQKKNNEEKQEENNDFPNLKKSSLKLSGLPEDFNNNSEKRKSFTKNNYFRKSIEGLKENGSKKHSFSLPSSDNSIFNIKRFSKNDINRQSLKNNIEPNNSKKIFMEDKDIIKEMDFEHEKELLNSSKDMNISNVQTEDNNHYYIKNNKYLNITNGIIVEESVIKGENDSEESKMKSSDIESKSSQSIDKDKNKMNYKSSKRLSLTNRTNKYDFRKSFQSSSEINFVPIQGSQKENKNSEEGENEIESDDLEELSNIISQNNNTDLFYSKCKEINILEDGFNEKFYNIINYELDNSINLIKKIKINNHEKMEYIRNYIENGLLIPIIFYFKKVFTLANYFTGKEMIKLYSLVKKCLKFKIYISKFKQNFWKPNLNEQNPNENNEQNMFIEMNEAFNSYNYYFTNYRNASIIEGSFLIENKYLNSTYESLDLISSNKISIFDYSSLYQIIEKELFPLIKERKLLNIGKDFKEQKFDKLLNKRKIKEEEKLINENKKYNSDIQKRLLRILIIYKYSKLSCQNEKFSSFFSILPEISLGYETNYRNLLIDLLINYGKDMNMKNEFADISYFLLFKLLCEETEVTQNEITNLLGGEEVNEDPGFLEEYSQILFYKIILLIIDFLNPADKLIQSNYFVSCNLIYIFKYLCIDRNYFFQFHLVKSLSYSYNNINNSFFKFNITKGKEEYIQKENNTLNNFNQPHEKREINNIRFYDFFLFLLTKIILISHWENNNDIFHPNPFLYDLFSSILDLLTEIIQGSKPELLSILFDSTNEKIIDILGKEFNNEKYKNVESFEIFIKNIVSILFEEKCDLKLINEIKNNIMHYITSILEEKNCNETTKKFIEKYLNINNIYKIISKIMKMYFLNNQKPKKFEKIKNQIAGLMNNKMNEKFIKISQPRRNRNSITAFRTRPKMNLISSKPKEKKKSIFIESTSSNKRLISTMLEVNKDFKKKFKDLGKNKPVNSLFKNDLLNNEGSFRQVLKSTKTQYEKKEKKVNKKTFDLELKISKLTFGKKLYNYFRKHFYNDPKFVETLEFKLSNSFYRFIKIITLDKDILEKNSTFEQITKMDELDLEDGDINLQKQNNDDIKSNKKDNSKYNINFEKDLLEKYYIERFFETITTTVEIRSNEGINKTVIYTRIPVMQFLSKATMLEFKKNVNRDNETSKKYDLIRYTEYFIKEIQYYKKYHNKWDIWLSKINFYYLEIISYLYAFIYNLFLLFTIKGDVQITKYNTIKERYLDNFTIKSLIEISINKWNIIYEIFNFIYLILNTIFILLWICYKLPLFFKEDTIKYREIYKKEKKKLNIFEKIFILIKMCIFERNYIKMIIYEFFLSIVCLNIKKSEILYPFLLIPILFINKTLKNIIISIKLNLSEFSLTFCFAFIIIYIFANIYFFFENSDFYYELKYYSDNYCKTLVFAFLNALDNGLRARGGLGDSAKRISFLRNSGHYLVRLVLDDIFFLLIVIIMIDMVFGIVVKSFDELRNRNQKYHSDKTDLCFICHSNRISLERMRINFSDHINNIHNVWNYVEYMISLKLKDIHDLSAINQYVRTKMDRKDITWLPTYKDINKEGDNDFDEKNLEVYYENTDYYRIKNISEIH